MSMFYSLREWPWSDRWAWSCHVHDWRSQTADKFSQLWCVVLRDTSEWAHAVNVIKQASDVRSWKVCRRTLLFTWNHWTADNMELHILSHVRWNLWSPLLHTFIIKCFIYCQTLMGTLLIFTVITLPIACLVTHTASSSYLIWYGFFPLHRATEPFTQHDYSHPPVCLSVCLRSVSPSNPQCQSCLSCLEFFFPSEHPTVILLNQSLRICCCCSTVCFQIRK